MTGHTWISRMATIVAAGGLLLASGLLTGPASAQAAAPADITPSCEGVLEGEGDGPLTKSLVSSVAGATAGTFILTFQLDSPRTAGQFRLRDCIFIDTGEAGFQGEPFIGSVDEKDVTFTFTPTGGSTATFTVTVTGLQPGDLLCDRAAVSGVQGEIDFTDKSNLLCFTPDDPPIIPEAPFALMLPLVAAGAIGGVLFVRRRRNPDASTLAV